MKHRYFQYRLKPTDEQRKTLESYGSAMRWVWNYCLDLNQKQYKENKKFVFRHEMLNLLPKLKKRTYLAKRSSKPSPTAKTYGFRKSNQKLLSKWFWVS